MVIGDDIIAQGFFSELVREQGRRIDYLPPAVCLRNRKAPIDFPCREVIDYEIDSREPGRRRGRTAAEPSARRGKRPVAALDSAVASHAGKRSAETARIAINLNFL